jgi:hypothetical protein
MANLIRNFIKGRMNKSVDERLVPQGEYIDAQNIRMGSTEESEIGAVENSKGNTQLTTLVYPPTGTPLSDNATCLGAYSDGANETMYWFVHDPAFTEGATGKLDLIVSYNMRSNLLTYHVVSIEDPTDPTGTTTTLNFDPQYLITGVNLVDDLLFFTDDFNAPRRINVTTAYPEPVAFVDGGLLGDDILVIKRPPNAAPVVTAVDVVSREDYMEDRFLCFGYRWEYANNEYSATSQFSAPIFESEPFAFTTESYLNEGMVNSVQVCDVTVRTGSSLVKGIDILFKEMDDNIIRVIEKVDKADSALTDNSDYTIQFSKRKIFTILPESEILRLYDNVPRRAKAQTLMGNRIVYGNYLEGYNMRNLNGQTVKLGFNATLLQTPLDAETSSAQPTFSAPSLHSNRVYEIGIVYMDEFGRSSTALVAPNNKVELECGDSIFQNQIRVTIPSLMLAPSWASRYKFVIKPDTDLYETIYTNQFFVWPVPDPLLPEPDVIDVYFLLEGENAAKVEKGDRYIVKSDSAGAVTSCTYAEALEKKTFAVGELDDTGTTPIPAIGGTYMKMNPDFAYGPAENSSGLVLQNTAPGEQSAGTNGGSDQRTENGQFDPGDYPVLVYKFNDKTLSVLNPVPAGSRIRLTFSLTRQGRGDGSGGCEKLTLDFDHTWEVETDYNDIIDWFYGTSTPNDVIATIEAAEGFTGDVNGNPPEMTVLPEYTGPDTDTFGVPANTGTVMLWTDQGGAGGPWLVIYGVQKCGGVSGGNSPNRRSRVKASLSITRATQTITFETEPTPALPDLWYESSASYTIDPFGNHYGNVQNQINATGQPGIVDTAFFNCFSYGNGVESYKIRDSIKGKPLTLGNRVTTTSDERFSEVRRFADLTYSGVINDETNINKLNEFNLGLLNFKPLEDSYGPVEKLFGRRTDILTLQEDKISYVLAGKNLLTDTTGESLIASVPEVLGTQVARVEDFGISNNPESFAEWGPHKFFTDAKRGAVIHLYGDGQKEQLEVISENGMRSWFRDMFIADFNTQKLGGYDPYMNEYVLASNEIFLPGQEDCIECNTIQTFLLTPTEQSFCVNLGNTVGPVSVDYIVVEAEAGDEATITTTYPNTPSGTSVITGPITSTSQPSVPDVNKNSITDNSVGIDLNYTGSGRFIIQVQVKCPNAQDLNVRLITVSRDTYRGQSIHSEFQWQDGTFVSPLSSTAVTFDGGVNPIISDWQEYTVSQGSNLGPIDGSTVTMMYNRLNPDNYILRAVDRLGLLRSSTNYTQADIVTLLADPALTKLAPTGADPLYTADFLMPNTTDEYLYLIWDYSNGSTPPPASFLLDTYTGAAAGYSVRRIASSATNLMRIREDSGDTETDIGYDSNGDLDLAAIASHCGSANGYVVTWYDQAGSNNATQSTGTAQPQIYNGTAVITENGKPALSFSTDTFDFTITGNANNFSSFTVATNDATTSSHMQFALSISPRWWHWYQSGNAQFWYGNTSITHSAYDQSQHLSTMIAGSTLGHAGFWIDNVKASTTATLNTSAFDGSEKIGDYPTGGNPWDGTMQEIVLWPSDQSSNRTGIETDINGYFSIYT